MSQVDIQDLEKLSNALDECQIVEKSPGVILSVICDPCISVKFPKPKRIVPPVFLHKPTKFEPYIRKVLNIGINFYRSTVSQHYTKICCQTFDDHKALIQYFKNKQLPFHTYDHPDNRKMKVVFRGLPKNVDLNNLKNELKSVSIPVVRVHKMHNKDCAKDYSLLVLVVVPNNDAGRQILQVNKYFEHDIEIEPLNLRYLQCHRCQKWGHAQRYCNGNVKCVKCGCGHLTQKCTKNKIEELPKCANCGSDHTSSFKLCPFYPGSIQYVNKVIASAVSKGMFNDVCAMPRKLVTLQNCHHIIRGRD